MSQRNVSAEALTAFVELVLTTVGVRPEDAAVVSDSLIQADLRGVHSHGVIRLPGYVRDIVAGKTKAQPDLRYVADESGQAVLDADGGMGQIAAAAATRRSIDLARQSGLGAVAVRNSTHCGAMAYYAMLGLEHDMIGIATTNAGINMMPTGGRRKLVGNNPVAIAVPTNRPCPMVLDMATSVAAGGKLDVMAARGLQIPLGWAVDSDGRDTTDPVAGRQGALLPIGGPKGYGLAVILDVLSGVLSGGRFGAGLGGPGSGHFFLMLKVHRFISIDAFKSRMDELIDQLHACPPSEVGGGVLVPGEIEYHLQANRLTAGIPLDSAVVDSLNAMASDRHLPPLVS